MRIRDTRFTATVVAATCVMLLAACSSSSTPSSGGSGGSQSEASSLTTLTLALPTAGPLANIAFIPVGIDKGYFREKGIDLQIQYLPGAGAISAVQAGQADIALTSPAALIQANAQGGDMKSIYQIASESVFSYGFIPGSDVQSLDQLAGHRIGVVATANVPASLTYINFDLAQQGLRPVGVANLIPTGEGASAIAAVQSNQVDAFFLTDTGLQTMKSAGIDIVVEPVKSLSGGFPGLALMAQSKVISSKTEALKNFLAAFTQATDYCVKNGKDCIDDFAKLSPEAVADIASAYAQWDVRSKLYVAPEGSAYGRNNSAGWKLAVSLEKAAPDKTLPAPESVYTNDLL